MKLQQFQLSELREISKHLVQSRHWNDLSWSDAWCGKYPKNTTDAEIKKELLVVIEKVERIINHGMTEDDFKNTKEYLRTMAIKSCRSLKYYRAINF